MLCRHFLSFSYSQSPQPWDVSLGTRDTLISNCLFALLCASPSPRRRIPPEQTPALVSGTQPRARHRAGPEFPLPFNGHFESVFSSAPASRLRGSQVCVLSPFLRPCLFNLSFLDLRRTCSSSPRPFRLRLHLTHSDPTPIIQAHLPSKPRGSEHDCTPATLP